MLPYSPLHHVLLADFAGPALVMTSGNVSDEPIAYRDEDALERLAGIADLFLVHDRPDPDTHRRFGAPRRRRSGRGPPGDAAAVARVRPGQHAAPRRRRAADPRVRRGAQEHVLRGQGDAGLGGAPHRRSRELRDARCRSSKGSSIFERLFAVTPEVVAHDLHPEYLSTKYAVERDGVELVGVQHHHAHLAATLAEHGEPGTAVGAIFDGSGYGTDGTVWGGELLCGDLAGFERVGMLRPVRLPGGAAAIREPWRMACAWLAAVTGSDDPDEPPPLPAWMAETVDERTWGHVAGLARTGLSSPVTTSMGRLFDAVGGALRAPDARELRGPGGDRARGGVRPRRARPLPDLRRDRAGPRDRSARHGPGPHRRRRTRVSPAASLRAGSTRRSRSRRSRPAPAPRSCTAPTGSCCRGACSRTGA